MAMFVAGPGQMLSVFDVAHFVAGVGYLDEASLISQTCHYLYEEEMLNHMLVNHRSGPEGRTRLWYACLMGDIPRIQLLLDHGARPSQEDYFGRTLLSWLIRGAHAGPLRGERLQSVLSTLLASQRIEVNLPPAKESLLNESIAINDLEVTKLLLAAGADVNQASGGVPQTPLMRAVGCGQLEHVRLLLQHKADVHAKDAYGGTVLSMLRGFRRCTGHEGFACLELLLEHGADASGVQGIEAVRAILGVSTSVAQAFTDAPVLVMRLLKAGAALSNWGFNLGELRRIIIHADNAFSFHGPTPWTPDPSALALALHASVPLNKKAHFARDILPILIARKISGADHILATLSEPEAAAISPVLFHSVVADEEYPADAVGEFDAARVTLEETLRAREGEGSSTGTRDAQMIPPNWTRLEEVEMGGYPVPSVVPARSWARKAATTGQTALVGALMRQYPGHAHELLISLLYYAGWSEVTQQSSSLSPMLSAVLESPQYAPTLAVAIQGMACTLMAAIARQGLDVLARQMLESGSPVDLPIRWGMNLTTTPLALACVRKDVHGATVQQAIQAQEARVRTVQALLEAGANPNASVHDANKQLSTPFTIALTSARDAGLEPCLGTLALLLEHGADASRSFTDKGKQYTPVVFAQFRRWTAAARRIQDHLRKLRVSDSDGEEAVVSFPSASAVSQSRTGSV